MKSIGFAFMFFILTASMSVAQSVASQIPPAPADKAVVYFMRMGKFGQGAKFEHYDNNRFIGKFTGLKYLRYECEPGEHFFWVRSENCDYVPANLEAGRNYLIQEVLAAGVWKARVKLYPIDPNEFKRIARMEKKILRKKSIQPTTAQLEKHMQRKQKVIAKGLAKYEIQLAKGKEFRHLEATQYVGNVHR